MEVISKRSQKFYSAVFLTIIFFGGLAAFLTLHFINKYNSPAFDNRYYFLPIIIISVIGFGYNVLLQYLTHAPKIIILEETIKFNNKIYQLKDITSLRLTGKSKLDFLIWGESECAKIRFTDGTTRYIIDNLFSNFADLKNTLKKSYLNLYNKDIDNQIITTKQDVAKTAKTVINDDKKLLAIENTEVALDNHFYIYKGNIFINFRQLILIIFIIGVIVKNATVKLLMFACVLAPLVYFISNMLYYIGISDTHILIKNHNYFWINKMYPLKDIREIVFETAYKSPNAIRIIYTDFSNKLFYASSLTDKQWLELKTLLEQKNIVVRNEAIPT